MAGRVCGLAVLSKRDSFGYTRPGKKIGLCYKKIESCSRWRYVLIYAEWKNVSWCHMGRWEELGEALGSSDSNLNMAGHGPSRHVFSFAMATSKGAMGTQGRGE